MPILLEQKRAVSDTAMLAIETSCVPGSVAIRDCDGRVHQVSETTDIGKRSQHLIVMIRDLLSAHQLAITDLNRICVSHGPGSFTGLRVGVVTAKTLAYALKIPIFAIPTFQIIAHQVQTSSRIFTSEARLCVIADAFRGHLFVQHFRSDSRTVPPLDDVHMETPHNFLASLTPHDLVVGPGVSKVAANLLPSQRVESTKLDLPQATSLIHYSEQHAEFLQPADPFKLIPLYIRSSAAEEKRQATDSR